MPILTLQPSGKTVEAESGKSLLSPIMAAGETIMHKCEAKAECGSWHIYVKEGRKNLSKIQRSKTKNSTASSA